MEEANPSSSGVAVSNQQPSPCCSEWKKKLVKSEEKRNALRQAVKLFESQMDKIQAENVKLKQEFEKVKLQVKLEKEEKDKEVTLRQQLEKEIDSLKLEFSSVQKDDCLGNTDQYQKQQLETRVLECEAHTKRLEQLLDKEKKKLELEKKKFETEKNKTREVQKVLEIEKRKVEEEKKFTELNRRKAEEYQNVFEKFKLESNGEKEKLIVERNKAVNASKKAEAERQKVIKDIKHAETDRARAEEALRSLEAERKRAIDEKARADHLSKQLKLESRKREELQEEMERKTSLMSVKKCQDDPYNSRPSTGYENVKLLKEKLKHVKRQGKHARRVHKLQEMENDLLRRELHLLKQEFVNFSWHLNLLGGHLSQSVKGIAGLTKEIDNSSKPTNFGLNDKSAKIPYSHISRGKNEGYLHTICSKKVKTRECAGHLLPEVEGSLSCPISGINSDLESPIGESIGKKSQSSVECSTTASFSDRTSMGSQERDPPAATTSTKMAGKNMVGNGDISGVTTKLRKGKSIGNISERNDGDHASRKWSQWSNLKFDGEHGELESSRREKRRKIHDASDTIGWMSSKEKMLHSDLFSEKLSVPMLVPQTKDFSKPLGNECIISDLPFLFEENKKGCTDGKRKKSKMGKIKSIFLCQKYHHGADPENVNGTGFFGEHAQSICRFPLKKDTVSDIFCCEGDEVDISYLDEMIKGDLMKFLELDNAADEERYRAAVAMPLSPTLPVLTSTKLSGNYSYSNEERVLESSKNDKDRSVTPDVADLEVDVYKEKSSASSSVNGGILVIKGNHSNNAAVNQRLSCKRLQPASVKEIVENAASDPKKSSNDQLIDNGFWNKSASLFCVAYLNAEEEVNILRLFRALEAVIFQSPKETQTDNVLARICSFSFFEDIQSMEKASIIFSLLLYHASSQFSADTESFIAAHKLLGPFEAELSAGLEIQTQFVENCKVDCLIKVIEHFLIRQEIYTYTTEVDLLDKGELSFTGDCTNKRDGCISPRRASVNQLVAGSMILASICKVFNNVGFLWEVSYKILRNFSCNSSSVLTLIHSFASVCGEKFFSSAEKQISAIVIKSIVLHLELCQGSSHLNPADSVRFPCKECPFVQGAVCLDKMLSLLMSKLEHLSGTSKLPSRKEDDVVKTSENSHHNSVLHAHGDCDGSCCILDYEDLTCQSNCVSSETLCSFVDVISLVELAANFKDWCWTSENIVPRLLEMVQLCPAEGYASALLVLIGNLGRMGVDADGYDYIHVAELRSSISKFLDLDATRNGSFLVQVAAVGVITDLLPLSFKEIVGDCYENLDASSCSHAKNIKSWFSQLTEKQKNMLSHLFEYGDVTR